MNETIAHVVSEEFADISGEVSVKFLKSSSSNTQEYRMPCVGNVTYSSYPQKLPFNVIFNPHESIDQAVMVEYVVRVGVNAAAVNTNLFKLNGLAFGVYLCIAS